VNVRKLVASDAPLMLANDGAVLAARKPDKNTLLSFMDAPEEEGIGLGSLATGHFFWFRAMEEKGCAPLRLLQAATKNIAEAYGVDEDLGTLEVGKIADLLVLDRNPFEAARNYESISTVIKAGTVVDRDSLPENPIFTKGFEPPEPEEAIYVPTIATSGRFPGCPGCRWH
jgi:hypothetical protein